jgi:hypothetical protein
MLAGGCESRILLGASADGAGAAASADEADEAAGADGADDCPVSACVALEHPAPATAANAATATIAVRDTRTALPEIAPPGSASTCPDAATL